MSVKNRVSLGIIVCHVPCAMCHDEQLVIATSTQVVLQIACITLSPQLFQECHRKHNKVEKGKHSHREKRFQDGICGDSPPFTHPH